VERVGAAKKAMDFVRSTELQHNSTLLTPVQLSRLIGGTSRQKQQTSPQKDSPRQRLERFERIYDSILVR